VSGRLRVVIVGGGVGALETMLALHDLAGGRVDATLLSPETEFRYRPASVALPFGRGQVHRFAISDAAAAADTRHMPAALDRIDATEHLAFTDTDGTIPYDVSVIACGAQRVPALPGALVFRGEEDVDSMKELLEGIDAGAVKRVIFAVPSTVSWQLPLYELALLTATHVGERRILGVKLELVTPESRPLAEFGGDASTAVEQLLGELGIVVHTSTHPVRVHDRGLDVVPSGTLAADRVVSVPHARGVPIAGLPHDREGFLPVDDRGRVRGLDDVFAVGDVTDFPIKQGGIAAGQADLVAHIVARQAGAPLAEPPAARPVLRGLLITGGTPRYLFADPTGGHGETAEASTDPLWWPGGKIAAHHLGYYLANAPTLD